MMYPRTVTSCDFTGRRYDKPVEGAAFVARGATGRWCEVMHAGPEWLAEHPEHVRNMITREAAREEVKNKEGHDYADF